jgi:hypothetical protein
VLALKRIPVCANAQIRQRHHANPAITAQIR